MDNKPFTMSNVALWDKETVNEFLKKNKIYGLVTLIEERGLDGIGFMNLDLDTLKSLGVLNVIERCKINALLNSLGSESYRKEFTRRWSECPGAPSESSHATKGMSSPGNDKRTHAPALPEKPCHLKHSTLEKHTPTQPRPAMFPVKLPPLPAFSLTNGTDNKAEIIEDSLVDHDEVYEVLVSPTTTPNHVADWDECDIFSSDEFSDSDGESRQPDKCDVRTQFRKISYCDERRQPDPTSTPPPLPVRNRDNTLGDSSLSLNSDRSETASQARKIFLPAPTVPPPPPPDRALSLPAGKSQSLSPLTSPLSRSPRELSPAPDRLAARSREDSIISSQPWYYNVGRRDADRSLRQCVEGAFLVRPTEHGGQNHRYTMSIIFNRRIFHIPVRQKWDGRWALGSEKDDEETFESVERLVEEHRLKPINLHTDGRLVGTTCLVIWPSSQTF